MQDRVADRSRDRGNERERDRGRERDDTEKHTEKSARDPCVHARIYIDLASLMSMGGEGCVVVRDVLDIA